MSKTLALNTLFYPYETARLPWPVQGQRVAFFNAQNHAALRAIEADLYLQQNFKPYAQELQNAGFETSCILPIDENETYDTVFIALPKNRIEAAYLIARALQCLKSQGILVVAAANKAGGARIVKMLAGFGLIDCGSESKNKGRVCWAIKENVDQIAVDMALKDGQVQDVLDGAFQSQPGLFGWNKIDKGSALLLQHLPNDLTGKGADFGCGYGLLARHVLQNCNVRSLTCIDADARAVELCRVNVQNVQKNAAIDFIWADLTVSLPVLKNLDFIVMNPPFHEGKFTDADIGKAFINSAYESLKRKGKLWMVANSQLPYEPVLNAQFYKVEKVFEGAGFKIFCAEK